MKYLNFRDIVDQKEISECARILINGGIGIYPTETVYGIGVNGLREDSVEKVFKVKERPLTKPINLLVSSIDMINAIAKDITDIEYKIIENFFPGPLTIILKKKDCVPNIVTSNGDTVGVRMPEEDITLKLIKEAGVPLATPSANITGKKSGTNYEEIIKDFEGKVDFFIDNGPSRIGEPSTIVKVENGTVKILRQGSITLEEILEKIK